jgi:hypothetical protein
MTSGKHWGKKRERRGGERELPEKNNQDRPRSFDFLRRRLFRSRLKQGPSHLHHRTVVTDRIDAASQRL